jgi:hypothetical protein
MKIIKYFPFKNVYKHKIKYLFSSYTEFDKELWQNAYQGNLKRVKELAAMGADVKANNYSALRLSASNGKMEVVQYLLQNGSYDNRIAELLIDGYHPDKSMELLRPQKN